MDNSRLCLRNWSQTGILYNRNLTTEIPVSHLSAGQKKTLEPSGFLVAYAGHFRVLHPEGRCFPVLRWVEEWVLVYFWRLVQVVLSCSVSCTKLCSHPQKVRGNFDEHFVTRLQNLSLIQKGHRSLLLVGSDVACAILELEDPEFRWLYWAGGSKSWKKGPGGLMGKRVECFFES